MHCRNYYSKHYIIFINCKYILNKYMLCFLKTNFHNSNLHNKSKVHKMWFIVSTLLATLRYLFLSFFYPFIWPVCSLAVSEVIKGSQISKEVIIIKIFLNKKYLWCLKWSEHELEEGLVYLRKRDQIRVWTENFT